MGFNSGFKGLNFYNSRNTGVELWRSNYITSEMKQETMHGKAECILPDAIQASRNSNRSLE